MITNNNNLTISVESNFSLVLYEKSKETGRITVLSDFEGNYFSIDFLMVRKECVHQNLEEYLIQWAIQMAISRGYTQIIAYPGGDAYDGDMAPDPEYLYQIFLALGFQFAEPEFDLSKPNQKMILDLPDLALGS